ncbi:hypothetical protein E2562_015697 [Oryza meyeriana var. granulata]|uniref:Uncharacterized protein n=1 Tax=Oryza meyeriana var. granulata TaxID=110450 RepID=A0A6G1D2V5_9ORYZ|nr:hypothetical protein E2562_015697 [Oryza meyeriana var. granulata]
MAPPSGAAVPPGGGIPQVEPHRFFGDIFPQDHADFSWVLDRMDPNSSYRLAVRVGAYVKFADNGGREYCDAYKKDTS